MLLNEAKTDWLASRNIFYNINANEISDNINDLIDLNNISFDEAGLYNYLKYGYSVFGYTPISGIRMLEHDCHIFKDADGKLVIEKFDDPFDKVMGNTSKVEDVLELIEFKMNTWENSHSNTIIVPTSGGFDSRLLNSMIKDEHRVKAFTYGISMNQSESFECVYAKRICDILGFEWNQIELGEFLKYIDEWYGIFGVCTHTHGMYQMEFYKNIKSRIGSGGKVLSGIQGDIWAGKREIPELKSSRDVSKLQPNYGICADVYRLYRSFDNYLEGEYYQANREKLKDPGYRVIEAGRMNIKLLSYLMRVAENEGYEVWSPFLDFDVVSAMVNLPLEERKNRKWQVDYFGKRGLLASDWNLTCDFSNALNYYAYSVNPVAPLNETYLGKTIDKTYIRDINSDVKNLCYDNIQPLYVYFVLKPLELLYRAFD